jgi:hypothetical protein
MGKDAKAKAPKKNAAPKREKRVREEVVSREATINLHKRIHGVSVKIDNNI